MLLGYGQDTEWQQQIQTTYLILLWAGPGMALPLLGHLPIMNLDPRSQFHEFRKKYGDVFSLYLGTRFVVVLCGFDTIKKAFVKNADAFSSRPHTFLTDVFCQRKGWYFETVFDFTNVAQRLYQLSFHRDRVWLPICKEEKWLCTLHANIQWSTPSMLLTK